MLCQHALNELQLSAQTTSKGMLFLTVSLLLAISQAHCKPVAIASVIHGTENDKFCAKTEGEKEKQIKAEERPDMFEGDVVMTGKLAKMIEQMNKTKQRDVISIASMKWKSPIIPYVFDKSLSERTKQVVKAACTDYEKYTCIKCVPRTTETDYIRFFVGKGCWSFVGRQSGMQDLSLGSGCDYKGTVLHEMLHALGFFHEHTRLDRDEFVTINWAAIKTGMDVNFKKYAVGVAEYFSEPYDYNSIMHYPENAFSIDTRNTITVKAKSGVKVGQRLGLSDIDVKQIKKAYQCSDAKVTTPTKAPIPPTTIPIPTIKQKVTTAGPPSPPMQPIDTTKAPLSTPPVPTPVPPPMPGATTSNPSSVDELKSSKTIAPPQATAPTQLPVLPTREGEVTAPINIDSQNLNGQRPHFVIKIKTGVSPPGTYPSWPNDFNWNTNGMPQACNCQTCSCRCIHVNEPKAGEEWQNNHLCYKRGISDPGIEWSYNGPLKGKRCTHLSDPSFGKYWDNNFLCVPNDSPYHFVWSFRGPLEAKNFSCIRMGIPDGPKEWRDNFLCAKKPEQD